MIRSKATTGFCAEQQTNVYMDEIFHFKDITEVFFIDSSQYRMKFVLIHFHSMLCI